MQIDSTDRRILIILQRHGRMSNADVAERVNLSASAC
ncbi:MAG: Lrp/AsnC family transcriptional regulator, partial [Paracoccaceae bacterium]